MRRAFYALTLMAALPAVAAEQGIGGLYDSNGTNFDGSPCKEKAQITITSNTTCEIVWRPVRRPRTASACAMTTPLRRAM